LENGAPVFNYLGQVVKMNIRWKNLEKSVKT
jgi:hypothetical protein